MKGFAGVIALIAITIIAVLIYTQTNNETELKTNNEEFLKIKMFLAQYEIAITQALEDCNTRGYTQVSQVKPIIQECIDNNTQTIFNNISKYIKDTNCIINKNGNWLDLSISYSSRTNTWNCDTNYQIICETIKGNSNSKDYFYNKTTKIVRVYKKLN